MFSSLPYLHCIPSHRLVESSDRCRPFFSWESTSTPNYCHLSLTWRARKVASHATILVPSVHELQPALCQVNWVVTISLITSHLCKRDYLARLSIQKYYYCRDYGCEHFQCHTCCLCWPTSLTTVQSIRTDMEASPPPFKSCGQFRNDCHLLLQWLSLSIDDVVLWKNVDILCCTLKAIIRKSWNDLKQCGPMIYMNIVTGLRPVGHD